MVIVRAEVVAVGSEMLTPTHLDTNSLYITERLNELGIDLQGKSVAGDDRDVLKAIVSDALGRSDLVPVPKAATLLPLIMLTVMTGSE